MGFGDSEGGEVGLVAEGGEDVGVVFLGEDLNGMCVRAINI